MVILKNIKAIIFDLDGVLVSTDILHKDTLIRAVYDIALIDTSSYPGISAKSMLSTKQKLKVIQGYYGFCDDTYEKILLQKDKLFFNGVKNLVVDENVIQCLTYIKSLKIKTAIASNSRHANIDRILDITDLRKYINVVVSADDVPNRKPAPDILFETYRRLVLKEKFYSHTLFIEDSDEGVEAGNNSPSTVIRINNPIELTVELIKSFL